MQNINLTPLIQALIAVLAALITYRLVPWIRSKTTGQQRDNLQALIRILVFAAEQIYGAGRGEEKLEYVCERLRERGFEVSLPEIEAEVYKAFNMNLPMLGSAENDGGDPEGHGDAKLNLSHWSLDQLKHFCALNGIAAAGCVTEEDFIAVIEHSGRVSDQPPDEAGETPAEGDG